MNLLVLLNIRTIFRVNRAFVSISKFNNFRKQSQFQFLFIIRTWWIFFFLIDSSIKFLLSSSFLSFYFFFNVERVFFVLQPPLILRCFLGVLSTQPRFQCVSRFSKLYLLLVGLKWFMTLNTHTPMILQFRLGRLLNWSIYVVALTFLHCFCRLWWMIFSINNLSIHTRKFGLLKRSSLLDQMHWL
jgi:hypothetical protein